MWIVFLIALLILFFLIILPLSLAIKRGRRQKAYIASMTYGKSLTYQYNNVKIVILQGQEPDFDSISAGDIIYLIQEPNNPYDNKAVAIYSGNHRLGYIYRGDMQDMINDYIDRGDFITAKISDIRNKQIFIDISFFR